jgi:hypothetical protein
VERKGQKLPQKDGEVGKMRKRGFYRWARGSSPQKHVRIHVMESFRGDLGMKKPSHSVTSTRVCVSDQLLL